MTPLDIHRVDTSSDLFDLKKIVKGILGKPCLRVSMAFINDLCLEFGDEVIKSTNRRGKPIKMGEWFLTPRRTYWTVEVNGVLKVNYEQEEEEILSKLAILKGLSVLDYQITFPNLGLSLLLEKDFRFIIQPSIGDIAGPLPYWRMFTPDNMFIEVGPGQVWSISPADEPISN